MFLLVFASDFQSNIAKKKMNTINRLLCVYFSICVYGFIFLYFFNTLYFGFIYSIFFLLFLSPPFQFRNEIQDLSYKEKHWHEACFLCNKCRVSLVDKQFGSKAEKIYCGNCYDSQFASRCDGCGEVFRAGMYKWNKITQFFFIIFYLVFIYSY